MGRACRRHDVTQDVTHRNLSGSSERERPLTRCVFPRQTVYLLRSHMPSIKTRHYSELTGSCLLLRAFNCLIEEPIILKKLILMFCLQSILAVRGSLTENQALDKHENICDHEQRMDGSGDLISQLF